MASPKKYKLDIFDVLKQLSVKNREFYAKLNEEQQKAFMPLIVMRWLSGTRDARQIVFLNELVNPFVFSLYHHKELLAQLMATCTSGSSRRYIWNKAKTKASSTPLALGVIREIFGYNSTHAADALSLLSASDILEYAEQLGRQKDEIAKLKKELKNRESSI